MLIQNVQVPNHFITVLRENLDEGQMDAFWREVKAELQQRIGNTEDTELPALKARVRHVEELRGLFREIFSKEPK